MAGVARDFASARTERRHHADLTGARLARADLRGPVRGLTSEQLSTAVITETTKLPAELAEDT